MSIQRSVEDGASRWCRGLCRRSHAALPCPATLANENLLFTFVQKRTVLAFGLLLFLIAAGLPWGARLEAQALHQESIRFHSDGFTLAGTLYMPNGAGPHPAVVLFHGSGPAGRLDVPAQWFAHHGVAALTYDKRGVGESTGNWHDVAFMTLCDDGLAAIQLLKARPDIDKKRIGVWGLSQGGWLAPLAASRSNDIAFVIAVSGPGVSPGEQMIFFYLRELINGGMPKAQAEEASALRREVWTYMETGQ